MHFTQRMFIVLALVVIGVLIDLSSKAYVVNLLDSLGAHELVINKFFNFDGTRNYGISFGIFNQLPVNFIKIFIGIILGILFIYCFWAVKKEKVNLILISMVLSGATANFIDRLMNNSVYDFIDLHIGNFHWYTFNIADVFISVGISLILLNALLKEA